MNNQPGIPQPLHDMRQPEPSGRSAHSLDDLQRVQNGYLDLIQSCLTGIIDRDTAQAPFGSNTFNTVLREHGLDWPSQAQTMIGVKRLANLRALTESVIANNVPGDLIETGVWRGGACILMRAILHAYNVTDKCVWVADSFEGLPPANETKYPADTGSDFHQYAELAVLLEQVQDNFRAYGLLDEQVKFLKGWFKDTLPTAPFDALALMRLDGDMYESTMDALSNLYPKLSPHGYVIIDDYHVVPACKAAVHDYCHHHGIQPDIVEIDGVGIYWRKPAAADYDGKVMRLNQTVTSPNRQIARLNQAMMELSESTLSRLNHAIAERDEQIAELNHAMAERDAQIAGFNQTIAERDAQIARLNQTIAERDAQIAGFNQTIAERDAQIAGVNQTIAERDTQLLGLDQTIAERDAQIAGLSQAITERDGQVAGFNQIIAERDAQIAGVNQAMAERDTQLLALNQALTEHNDQIAQLNQVLTERDGQIAALNRTMAERDGQIIEFNQVIAERDRQIAEFSTEVTSFLSSRSWRITKPLRAVGTFLRNRRGWSP